MIHHSFLNSKWNGRKLSFSFFHVLFKEAFDHGIHFEAAFALDEAGHVRFMLALVVIAKCHSLFDAFVIWVVEIAGGVEAKTRHVEALNRMVEEVRNRHQSTVGQAHVLSKSAL